MDGRPKSYLYHYTKLTTAVEHVLPALELRMSPFSMMRDPLEHSVWSPTIAGYGIDEFGEESEESLRAIERLNKAPMKVNEAKDRFKLLALTADDPTKPGPWGSGWARASLWSTYADGGRGIFFEFDREKMIASVSKQLEGVGTHARSQEVAYEDRSLSSELFIDMAESHRERCRDHGNHRGAHCEALGGALLHKVGGLGERAGVSVRRGDDGYRLRLRRRQRFTPCCLSRPGDTTRIFPCDQGAVCPVSCSGVPDALAQPPTACLWDRHRPRSRR
jgi:hypothetical protein